MTKLKNSHKKDCFIIGARPTVIKFAPLIKKLNPFVLHTGQHRELANDMYKIFGIKPDIDLDLMKHNQTLTDFIVRSVSKLKEVFAECDFKRVWVHGDTSSALVGAWTACFNKITLIHNEAGLRTYDKENPYPEEIFRTSIDTMADYMFAPTESAYRNLLAENVSGKVFITGNTVVDALGMIKPKLPKKKARDDDYVLATVHRREAFGEPMRGIFEAIAEISKKIKVIFPIHPNPSVRKVANEVGLETVEPMDYMTFLWYMRDAYFIMTDSGGVQEEAPSLKTPVLVLRKCTERPEAVWQGSNKIIGWDKKRIVKEAMELLNNEKEYQKMIPDDNPYGDGCASDKIIEIMKNEGIY